MVTKAASLIALDVGEKRIGVAQADTETKFPFPLTTISVDGSQLDQLQAIINDVNPAAIVVGYPRNQSGEPTAQTTFVESFADGLKVFNLPIVFQDESLTSVSAEKYLKEHRKSYSKADIDAYAATIILDDYIEANYG